MRRERKIPTLIAIFILIVGLVVTSVVVTQAQRFFLKADSSSVVKEVKISNVADNSFSVSWITDQPVSGAVAYNDGKGFSRPVLDDRAQSASLEDKFYTHHITIRFLKPKSTYSFKIISGSQEFNDPSYKVTTAAILASPGAVSSPVYGTILKSDQTPVGGALIYLTINNSALMSTYSKSSGNWLVALNTARTSDLESFVTFKPKGDVENIFVQGGKDGVAQAKTVTGNDAPVPSITLGKNFDFTTVSKEISPNSTGSATSSSQPEQAKAGFVQTPITTPTPAILVPTNDSKLNDPRPTFQGTGIPGQVVQITVFSEQNFSASVIVGKDGRWSWSPPENLAPGEHTVTIATPDNSGQTKTISQKFLVLASGTSVTETATPSATLTLAPTLTPTPTATATPTPLPRSGSTTQTILLFFGGLVVLFLGGIFFYASAF